MLSPSFVLDAYGVIVFFQEKRRIAINNAQRQWEVTRTKEVWVVSYFFLQWNFPEDEIFLGLPASLSICNLLRLSITCRI